MGTRPLTAALGGAPSGATRAEQILLANRYRELTLSGQDLPEFRDVEFRNFSQNGEDGILLLLASVLGFANRRIVEFGSSDGIECNSANLVVHHGWQALLIDGNADALMRGKSFYNRIPETRRMPPTFAHEWVDRQNAGEILARHGFDTQIDILSVDLDGNDLWVLRQLEPNASIVVVEYNNRIPPDEAVSVPYDNEFVASGDLTDGQGFFGASLLAYDRMLGALGYRLVGANSVNTNAFFAHKTVDDQLLPTVSVASCLSAPWARHQCARWWPILREQDWVIIDD